MPERLIRIPVGAPNRTPHGEGLSATQNGVVPYELANFIGMYTRGNPFLLPPAFAEGPPEKTPFVLNPGRGGVEKTERRALRDLAHRLIQLYRDKQAGRDMLIMERRALEEHNSHPQP